MDIKEKVQQKIREQYLELLPEEELNKLITSEIDAFFDETNSDVRFKVSQESRWGSSDREIIFTGEQKMSPFRQMVWKNIMERTHNFLSTKIVAEYFNGAINISEEELSDKTKTLISSSIPLAINNWFERMAFGMVNTLANQIKNSKY